MLFERIEDPRVILLLMVVLRKISFVKNFRWLTVATRVIREGETCWRKKTRVISRRDMSFDTNLKFERRLI